VGVDSVTVESFGGSPSYVLRLPDRRVPGVLIQGDKLHALVQQLWTAATAVESAPTQEAIDDIRVVAGALQELLDVYEVSLDLEGWKLPYPKG
jgi:hypothetical protein